MLGVAAWLAGAPRAPAQGYNVVPPALRNEAEVQRELSVGFPADQPPGVPPVQVRLRLRVLADGTLDTTTVSVEHATDPAFAERAVAIARKLRFAPARIAGTPAAVWYHHTLFFQYYDPRPPSDEGTYELAAVEVAPRLENAAWAAREIARRYPPAQMRAGTPGDVLVRFKVQADGDVDSASVAPSVSTDTAFEASAVGVIRHMRFSPARAGGRPVQVWLTIPIHFEVQRPPADSATKTQPPAAAPAAPAQPSISIARDVHAGALAGRAGRKPGGPSIRRTEARA